MLLLRTSMTMEGSNVTIDEDILGAEPLRTATFTLSSSSSASSLCLQQDSSHAEFPFEAIFDVQTTENRSLLTHSQSLTLEYQRRRPVIDDPYQVEPNLQVLNDWMITTTGKSRQELSEAHGFSEEQIAVFEESFSLLDRDGDGNISHHEIHSLMKSLGYSPSEEDISSVISKADIGGDGMVDFDEFLTVMRQRRSMGEFDLELQQIFSVFDRNNDGFIDEYELYDLLLRLGENITQDDVKEMIEEADCLDGDGKVSFEEFEAILHIK